MRRLLCFFSMLLLAVSVSFAQTPNPASNIVVTEVEVTPVDEGAVRGLARVVINNVLEISEIQVLRVGGRTALKFPKFISKRGRVYPQVTVRTKQANDAILKAIETGKPSAERAEKISFNVTKFSGFTRPSKLKVFAAITFNDAIEVECKVMEGERGPWIAWPSRRPNGGGRRIRQVRVKNKALREAIEKTLLDRYQKILSEIGATGDDE